MIGSNKIIFAEAISNLDSNNAVEGWGENVFASLSIAEGKKLSFKETELLAEIHRLEEAEPMRLLRLERNQKLSETDWMAGSDVTMSDAWKKYRQDLRDLPASAKPELDENENLTNVTWPTKPS